MRKDLGKNHEVVEVVKPKNCELEIIYYEKAPKVLKIHNIARKILKQLEKNPKFYSGKDLEARIESIVWNIENCNSQMKGLMKEAEDYKNRLRMRLEQLEHVEADRERNRRLLIAFARVFGKLVEKTQKEPTK